MSHLEQRASDRDREQVVARLRDGCADGRLTTEELADRVSRAYEARTYADLDELTRDLPRDRRPAVPRDRATKPRLPGTTSFTERLTSTVPPHKVRAQVLAKLAPLLDEQGYGLRGLDEGAVVFERDERPGWAVLIAVLLFPFGLIALTQRRSRRIVVAFAPTPGGGSEITIYGTASLRLRRAFAELRG
jgi:hypothetical protein